MTMKTTGVLHPELLEILASAGHGDIIVLTDAGLRVPSGKRRVDLGLACGTPSMADTIRAVATDLVIEGAIVASEFAVWNPEVFAQAVAMLPVEPSSRPHAQLMADMASDAYAYVKTGECSAYASVALVCGVNYLDDAIALFEQIHGHRPE
jgi:D-ribose pyranase